MDLVQRRPHLVNIQALRAIAALLVVSIHMTLGNVGIEDIVSGERPWLGSFKSIGIFGVDLFFVISGFIMLVTNWRFFGIKGAGARFFVRRVIRIYPPYWLATLPVFFVLEFARDRFMVAHSAGQTGIVESFLLLPNQHQFILTVGWTLVWEMIFYVVFAAILPFERRFVPAILGLWFVIELVQNRILEGTTNFYLGFFHATLPIEFIFGATIGLLYVNGRIPAAWPVAAIATIATGLAFAIQIVNRGESFPFDRVFFFGLPAASIVLAAVAAEVRGVFMAPKLLGSLGDGSYSVYLWHISILVVLRNVLERIHPTGAVAHAAIIVLTIITILSFGQLIFHFFEKPVTTYLNRSFDVLLIPHRTTITPDAAPETSFN